ncbi:hypothetical protein Bbelb_024760 [Branchiostoma belcheri]|nr:hypothetical protein Bbelb_024760 [Branchiostoma belcheri]
MAGGAEEGGTPENTMCVGPTNRILCGKLLLFCAFLLTLLFLYGYTYGEWSIRGDKPVSWSVGNIWSSRNRVQGNTTTNHNTARSGENTHLTPKGFNLTKELIRLNPKIFSALPREFLPGYKNPCWFDKSVKASPDSQFQEKRIDSESDFLLRCLPYVYIIGQPKCGTTDLYSRITKHPDVVGGHGKEPHWWARRRFQHHLACITETWKTSDIPDHILLIEGYKIFRRDRKVGKGGGVAIFVDDDIPARRLQEQETNSLEVMWLQATACRLLDLRGLQQYSTLEDSVEEKVNIFYKLLMASVDQHLPCKSVRACDKSWVTERVKQAIKRRMAEFSRHGKSQHWRSLRNKVQAIELYSKLRSAHPQNWWSSINRQLGRSQVKSNRTTIDGVSEEDVAETLNQHFVEAWCVGQSLNLFPLQHCTCDVDLCSIGMVKTLLKGIDPRKASGPDELPTWILKEYAEDLAPIITHLFNTSYEQGVVPGVWKAAKVVLIPKIKGAAQPSDMRLAKLLERDPVVVQALFADMSKAFDRVDHAILIQRVIDTVPSPLMITWLHDYLRGRTQRVMANGKFSSWLALSDTLNIGYADDVNISRTALVSRAASDTTMSADAARLDSWSSNSNMLLNGKKSQAVYKSLIRPVLEYGNVLLVGCSAEQSRDIERVLKRALRIISCGGKRTVQNLPDLKERRELAAITLLKNMMKPEHPLHELVAPQRLTSTGLEGSASTMWDNRHWRREFWDTPNNEPPILVANLIRAVQPKARIIISLRNPTERAEAENRVSGLGRSIESLSLKSCRPASGRVPVRLRLGLYEVYLRDWFSIFPRDQILVQQPVGDENGGIFSFKKKVRRKPHTAYASMGPMLPETRRVLDRFYRPYNRRLAKLLNNTGFLWL